MGRFRDRSTTKSEKETAAEAEKETRRLITGWFKKCMQTGQEWADEKHREHTAAARAQLQPDLMEICGVGDPANIDYDNPHVKILWLMADPVNQRLAHNPKLREKLYDKMDDETWETYCYYVDEHGHTYKELFESRKESLKAVMYRRKLAKEETKAAKANNAH